jgi:hypothetical protein
VDSTLTPFAGIGWGRTASLGPLTLSWGPRETTGYFAHNGAVESSERESTLTIFLGLVPLSDEETTARRRIIRVVVYMDGAILLLLGFLFYKQSWTVVSGWILVNLALLVWYFIMIRRAARKR